MDNRVLQVSVRCGLLSRTELVLRDGFVRCHHTGMLQETIGRARIADISPRIDRLPSGAFKIGWLIVCVWLSIAFVSMAVKPDQHADRPKQITAAVLAAVGMAFVVGIVDQMFQQGTNYVLYHRTGTFTIRRTRATTRALALLRRKIRSTQQNVRARTEGQTMARAWAVYQLDELRNDGTITVEEYEVARRQALGLSRETGFTAAGGIA